MFPKSVVDLILRTAVSQSSAFYLLFHPLDLFDPDKDMAGLPNELRSVTRLSVPLSIKTELMNHVLEQVSKVGSFVTMKELAASATASLDLVHF